jgi:hypothetical protein
VRSTRTADERPATSGGETTPAVVLVLDPVGPERDSLTAALESAGYHAIAGGNSGEASRSEGVPGEGAALDILEASECIAGLHADLVVLDPVTPRGIAFASALIFLGTPALIVSREQALLDQARKAGLPATSKPIEAASLLALIREVLGARRAL